MNKRSLMVVAYALQCAHSNPSACKYSKRIIEEAQLLVEGSIIDHLIEEDDNAEDARATEA